MTAKRQNGETIKPHRPSMTVAETAEQARERDRQKAEAKRQGQSRPRASQAAGALRASMVAQPRTAPPAAPPTGETVAVASAPSAATTKYTANLDDATAIAFDGLALAARRVLGRRVDKSEILQALVLLAADDASLRDEMIAQLAPKIRRGPKKAGGDGR